MLFLGFTAENTEFLFFISIIDANWELKTSSSSIRYEHRKELNKQLLIITYSWLI